MKPLLAELHAHSTWSDGELPLPALVDLYGTRGFDVLCVTDHVVRSGVRKPCVDADNWRDYLDELGVAVAEARRAGAAIVAAHPHAPGENHRGTCRWWHERDAPIVRPDRYELVNRRDAFAWVAERNLPAVASGDFHRLEHLDTWKTLLPCAHNERAVVSFLRSNAPALLTPSPLVGIGGASASQRSATVVHDADLLAAS
jgi:3',5'-nucleoside bisphosphate phosphatase